MPAKYLNCPDGVTRTFEQCLSGCPKPNGECLSLPTRYELSFGRVWNGKASTTQLLNPTRMSYLQIIKDYAITPQERAYALLGTQHHKRLEIIAKKIKELQSEKMVQDLVNTGTLDLLEPDGDKWKLTDYKTWGAYSVAKIQQEGSYERFNASLQLNDYRLKVESLGFQISKMRWQITVRDGGTWKAKKDGITDKIMLIEADWLDNDLVTDYFLKKNTALMKALETNTMPELCDYEERWHGNRFGKYCDVMPFCPEGRAVNKLPPMEATA